MPSTIDAAATILSDASITLNSDLVAIEHAQSWWDDNYLYRRVTSLELLPVPVPIGHKISFSMPKSTDRQGKVRTDQEDIEVLWLASQGPDLWQVLGRTVASRSYDYLIEFALPYELADGELMDDIFVYYGNPGLIGIPPRPPAVVSDWPLSVAYNSNEVTYTKPGTEWSSGYSDSRLAKATLTFWGPQVRLYTPKGGAYGIAEIQIDEDDWQLVDLYSNVEIASTVVFTATDLGEGSHTIRVRVSGEKNPAASTIGIQIDKLEYRLHTQAIDIIEEQNSRLLWGGSLGGAQ